MYKSLGGFTWTGIFKETAVLQHECAADGELATTPKDTNVEKAEFNILESAQSLQASFASLKNVRVFISNSYFYLSYLCPSGVLHGSVQGLSGLRHLVELLYALCDFFTGHRLSVLLQQDIMEANRSTRHQTHILN